MRRPSGIRFEPPSLAAGPEFADLLRLAFAGVPPAAPRPDWSSFAPLDLDVRLPGAEFAPGRRASAAQHLRLTAFAEDLAGHAARAGLPVVFLKFAALALTSRVAVGRRNACDVDVLIPASREEGFVAALREVGVCRRSDYLKAGEQHSVPLFHASGLMLEVHDRLLGVRLPGGRRSVRFEDLERSGLLVALPGVAGAFVPSDEVLVAHLLVHGIAQHGLLPAEYPFFRLMGDLVDLGAVGWGSERHERVRAFIADNVSPEEYDATLRLAERLSTGDTAMLVEDSGEGVLLRHIVAGALDENYRNGLKLRAAGSSLTDGSRAGIFLRALPGALLLTRAEVDAIYGRPRSSAGYLARQLARPFDLLVRALRYAARRP